jgi:hypothetical protein
MTDPTSATERARAAVADVDGASFLIDRRVHPFSRSIND